MFLIVFIPKKKLELGFYTSLQFEEVRGEKGCQILLIIQIFLKMNLLIL